MTGAKGSNPPNRQDKHKKLHRLPKNAKVHKRPLIRPPIPSPYASASTQKVVYVSIKTPFMSAVKRVQKLLRLSEKRLIQSATTLQKQGGPASWKQKGGGTGGDDITEIARLVEKQKAAGRAKKGKGRSGDQDEETGTEQVFLKGSGKAVQKVMMLGLWFQQRTDQYAVQLRTRTVGTVDNIELDEDDDAANTNETRQGQIQKSQATAVGDADGDESMQEAPEGQAAPTEACADGANTTTTTTTTTTDGGLEPQSQLEFTSTRIRYLSVLEVAVSLR